MEPAAPAGRAGPVGAAPALDVEPEARRSAPCPISSGGRGSFPPLPRRRANHAAAAKPASMSQAARSETAMAPATVTTPTTRSPTALRTRMSVMSMMMVLLRFLRRRRRVPVKEGRSPRRGVTRLGLPSARDAQGRRLARQGPAQGHEARPHGHGHRQPVPDHATRVQLDGEHDRHPGRGRREQDKADLHGVDMLTPVSSSRTRDRRSPHEPARAARALARASSVPRRSSNWRRSSGDRTISLTQGASRCRCPTGRRPRPARPRPARRSRPRRSRRVAPQH